MTRTVALEHSWQSLIGDQFDQPYMQTLREFLISEKRAGKRVYPPGPQMFAAMDLVPVEQVKIVIIGQDPYHGPNQAMGLSFSVPKDQPLPPSLRNIYTEIQEDMGQSIDFNGASGDLSHWAEQGVLLLNAVLSVQHAQAASHQGKGWEQFTDELVKRLANRREGLIFMLWGSYAQKKAAQVAAERHHLLKAPHPSPLSAHRGFFGCKHFSAANRLLEQQALAPIDWLPRQRL
ncbi:MAG: uracil-DNA glycosylase [Luminiphilus sp.]|nr:uracil-DNA glycosylase [Pseudomonadales bacterium]MBL6813802.1 uracil-DNA glycosylase [Pseudomonadales bacterium]MBL6824163.1 uracil-DNA glycosylase [Luminiphilus sp.]